MSMMVQSGRFGGIPVVTWNPADKSPFLDLSGGNLVLTRSLSGSGTKTARATRGIDASDNGYFEVVVTASDFASPFDIFGVAQSGLNVDNYCGFDTSSWGYYEDTGQKFTNATPASYGSSYKTVGIVLGCAFKNGSVWFHRSGVYQNGGDPAANTGAAFTGITGTVFPAISIYRGGVVFTGRFKAADFTYSPPSGFTPWGV